MNQDIHVGDLRRPLSPYSEDDISATKIYKTPHWRYYPPQNYAALSPQRLVQPSTPQRKEEEKSEEWTTKARQGKWDKEVDRATLIKSVQDLLKEFKTKKSKLKKSKYPQKPKKAPNAYAIFFKERSISLRQEKPEIEQQDITKAVAKEWKEMSDTEKLRYKEKEDQERELQKENKTAYISTQVKRGKRFKITRPVDYPRRAKSAYVLFVADKKEIAKLLFEEECRQAKIKFDKSEEWEEWEGQRIWELKRLDKQRAIISKLGEMWNQLDARRKQVYKVRAKEDKTRFEKELKEWKEKNSVEDEFSAEGSLSSNSSEP